MKKFMRTGGGSGGAGRAGGTGGAGRDTHAANGHAVNGHARGGGGGGGRGVVNGYLGVEDKRSTISRYWAETDDRCSTLPPPPPAPSSPPSPTAALWEDPEFPAAPRSLATHKKLSCHPVLWMRPHDLCAQPVFWSGAVGAAGALGTGGAGPLADPHLRCGVEALALTPRLLERVAPPQSFRDRYCGLFRFRFWQFGEWVEVVVDDRLPTHRGRLLGAHPTATTATSFLLPLLEKAYAKLYGSYRGLSGGSVSRALQDLTGGIVQSFPLQAHPPRLTHHLLASAVPRSTLLVARVDIERHEKHEREATRLRCGLVPGRAYCVTGLAVVRGGAGADTSLVRLRAAVVVAGTGQWEGGEWTGAWARGSREWRALSDRDRDLLSARLAPVGEFWSVRGGGGRTVVVAGTGQWEGGEWTGAWARGSREWRALSDRDRDLLSARLAPVGEFWSVRGGGGRTVVVAGTGQWEGGEWTGAWARGSREWRALSDRDRDLLSARLAPVGEFWMCFEELVRRFQSLEVVHVGPDDWVCEPALRDRRPWRAVLARRRWRAGYNAGGGPHCTETTSTNPQFRVQIPRSSPRCHVVVSVCVCEGGGGGGGGVRGGAGFAVYAAAEPTRALDVTHHTAARETAAFFTLPPGEYRVVPQTRRPHMDARFLLRIYTDEQTDIWEVNEDNTVITNISTESMEDAEPLPAEVQAALDKLTRRQVEEIDAEQLRAVLRGCWRGVCVSRPSAELCRALVALRDPALGGRVRAPRLPGLVRAVRGWTRAWTAAGGGRAASTYRLRALLRAAGVTASNKVVECLVARYSHPRRRTLSADHYLVALARLHLAHDRYHSIDAKMKTNPLSLEEMILMTIYS